MLIKGNRGIVLAYETLGTGLLAACYNSYAVNGVVPAVYGGTYFFLLMIFGEVTNHFNPAITLAHLIYDGFDKDGFLDFLQYFGSQTVGYLLGLALVAGRGFGVT